MGSRGSYVERQARGGVRMLKVWRVRRLRKDVHMDC